VRCRTKHLVVFGTQKVLTRPWAAGQVTVAMIKQVPTTLVTYPDFALTEKAVNAPGFLDTYVEGWTILTQMALSREKVGDAFKLLLGRAHILAPADNTKQALYTFASELMKSLGQRPISDTVTKSSPAEAEVVLVADQQDREAMASARMLQLWLSKCGFVDERIALVGDADSQEVHKFTAKQQLLVCCTQGIFDLQTLGYLVQHYKSGGKVLPILCASAFEFPVGNALVAQMDRYTSGKQIHGVTAEDVGAALSLLFKTSSVAVDASAGAEDLISAVEEVKRRIEAPVGGDVVANFGRETQLVVSLAEECRKVAASQTTPKPATVSA